MRLVCVRPWRVGREDHFLPVDAPVTIVGAAPNATSVLNSTTSPLGVSRVLIFTSCSVVWPKRVNREWLSDRLRPVLRRLVDRRWTVVWP